MITFGRWARPTQGMLLRDAAPSAPATRPLATPLAVDADPERDCVEVCRDAQAQCLELVGHCVRMQGYYTELGHLRLLADCAKACEAVVDFLLRCSELRHDVAALCAKIADRCARDCERFEYDQRVLACAAACRRCAEVCRRLAGLPLEEPRPAL